MSKIIKYGDNVDTDVIIPARYLNTIDKKELASHCMEDLDPDFHRKATPGDIIAAGKNFGCGSSREHAPMVIKESGISLIIAESFARIFFRNAINIGLPIVECPEAARDFKDGDEVTADLQSGVITNVTRNKTYSVPKFPEFINDIIQAGGLAELVKTGRF
ncbi:MAG: 3-isopropylmalate dehydratase small subunit [Oscillospiraceae bacterium]|nr:3-isopropylmalate dehydratase small subunit [Oscillospiraceae bacterium]